MDARSVDDNPWLAGEGDRGADYHARMQAKAAEGAYLHGEADLVESLLADLGPGSGRRSVLDAGCGTGRVGIELARRGLDVVGVDLDPSMIAVARQVAADAGVDVPFHVADLAALDLGRTVDLVVAAGNVMVFLTPGTEGQVIQRLAAHLRPGGLLVAGFALRDGPSGIDLDLADHDQWCTEAGLRLHRRLATWEGEPYDGGTYAVSVHSRA